MTDIDDSVSVGFILVDFVVTVCVHDDRNGNDHVDDDGNSIHSNLVNEPVQGSGLWRRGNHCDGNKDTDGG